MLRAQLVLWEVQVVLQELQAQQEQAQQVQLALRVHKELLVRQVRKVIKEIPGGLLEPLVLLVLLDLQVVQVLLDLQDP